MISYRIKLFSSFMRYSSILNQITTDRILCTDIISYPGFVILCSLAFIIEILTFSIMI